MSKEIKSHMHHDASKYTEKEAREILDSLSNKIVGKTELSEEIKDKVKNYRKSN